MWGSVKSGRFPPRIHPALPPIILLVTVGTLGDLHPFIALGSALSARGAEVCLAGAEDYRAKVEAAGLAFAPVRPSFADMQRALGMDRAAMTRRAVERHDFLLRELLLPHLDASYEDVEPWVRRSDLVLTSSLAFGARLAAERWCVPWIGVVLQPLMFLSAFDPPVLPGAEIFRPLLRAVGPAAAAALLDLLKRVLDRQLRPVRRLRGRLGLPAGDNPMFEGQFSQAGAIGLYSTLMGVVERDFPRPTAITGFAFFDGSSGRSDALPEDLQAFLEAGSDPVVFTLGSLIVGSPGAFYRESVAAARRLGRRSVLLVGDEGLADWAPRAAADLYVAAYVPHSLLFPRACVIVHQGGIGTLAQALKAGRPQLIVPFYADQPDNAARACRLGLARRLAPRRYTASRAARELERLIAVSSHARMARAAAARIAGEGGAAEAASVVLDTLESLRRPVRGTSKTNP